MFEFLRVQFQLGRLNETSLHRYVEKGWISERQFHMIVEELVPKR